MQSAMLGPVGTVSRLTLGGGGIGQGWGETTADEAVATLHHAVDAGITLLDTAPMYGTCEAMVFKAFGGRLPDGVRITTKSQLGTPPAGEAEARLTQSLDVSLANMGLDHVEVFFLHSNICADDYVYQRNADRQDAFATRWSSYVNDVVPAMEKLKAAGKCRHWGITGTGIPPMIVKALHYAPRPAVVQAITNILDSAGGMKRYAEDENPRTTIAEAVKSGVGVLGIRAVQAGALTAAIDRTTSPNHPETRDYARAEPYRALCAELGEDPAILAHRYGLAIPGVDSVVLGVKNIAELDQCLEAERRGPLEPELMARIDALGLRNRHP